MSSNIAFQDKRILELSVFIQKYGDDEIAKILQVKKRTVSSWRRLERAPTPIQAYNIIKTFNGIIDWQGIYQPYVNHLIKKELK
ncbi:hypothetical protein [Spartinivicinus poritis]|uniref:XRE family transcriptional regulator n=1 Tax=Spartinivicinus poritis TaxID=2994640 RepID=A0ABT5UIL1_9GAMM|nr:hypothetical protein [Spartinivicinus sp. A2-2]MDE1466050.1 hypothetical protein [Spartinivicinus sp. A2-2]